MTTKDLIKKARSIAKLHPISKDIRIAEVGSALLTNKGKVYTGVSIHAYCGVGFCAEHSAIAEMVKHREYDIKKVVAVTSDGDIIPPCGRCRELMYQISEKNLDADIILGKNKTTKLKKLLPDRWQDIFFSSKQS